MDNTEHMQDTNLIKEFFNNQEIFVTGGSGFIGKALIEKILYSCDGIRKIFILLRPKKGKNVEERWQQILSTPIFDRLRTEKAHVLQKVHIIAGDCSELGLGISSDDLSKLQNVTIIYHSAASVRFDDNLRDAILLNTRGTHELVKIAENLKNLKAFMHVSTTFCNPRNLVVEEKIYPPIADWRVTIKLAETYDTELLNTIDQKYGKYQPNTYTFTKSLSEQIINDYQHKIPAVVFRPSIVISSIEEPLPGWIDNFNGPIGMLVACGIGIMRTNYGDPDIFSDFVPVDIVVRALMIATYRKVVIVSNEMSTGDNGQQLEVFNCATATISILNLGEIIETGKRMVWRNPFEKTLWIPGGSITRCWFWNFIRLMFCQILMSILIDIVLYCAKQKPMLVKLQRRIYHASVALHYFMVTSWTFKNEKFLELEKLVPQSEYATFSILKHANLDYDKFLSDGLRGAKRFLLKESPDSSPGAHMRMKVFQILDLILEFAFLSTITTIFFKFIYNKYLEYFY